MSDYNNNNNNNNEGSRRRDRHRRQKNQGGRNNGASSQRDATGTVFQRDERNERNDRSDRNDRRPERIERPELPPLPKLPILACARCGEPIQDITSAFTEKGGTAPVHFDCVLAFLQGAENLGANEKIIYIGQGKFAVVSFENPADARKFKIVRTIEWESRESKAEWRTEISELFSHVK